LEKTVYPDGSRRTFHYDLNGNKDREVDENGHLTTYTYDKLNRLETTTRGTAVTTNVYDSALQPKNTVIDANGKITGYRYDGMLRLTKVTEPAPLGAGPGVEGPVTTYDYSGPNSGGHVFDSSGFKPTLITDARGFETRMAYDALYRLKTKSQVYEKALTERVAVTYLDYDEIGNQNYAKDPLGHVTKTTHDALNRVRVVTYPDLSKVRTFYTKLWSIAPHEATEVPESFKTSFQTPRV
jgi:uncharacterized protein RhaS with RHS repeats